MRKCAAPIPPNYCTTTASQELKYVWRVFKENIGLNCAVWRLIGKFGLRKMKMLWWFYGLRIGRKIVKKWVGELREMLWRMNKNSKFFRILIRICRWRIREISEIYTKTIRFSSWRRRNYWWVFWRRMSRRGCLRRWSGCRNWINCSRRRWLGRRCLVIRRTRYGRWLISCRRILRTIWCLRSLRHSGLRLPSWASHLARTFKLSNSTKRADKRCEHSTLLNLKNMPPGTTNRNKAG